MSIEGITKVKTPGLVKGYFFHFLFLFYRWLNNAGYLQLILDKVL